MSYLNLAVEVTALPNGKYRVALQSPVGEASAEADSPFTSDELDNFLQILSRERRVSRQIELNTARDFGSRLFAFLFNSSSEISNAYFGSLRDSGTNDGLRVRLTVEKAGALSALPWETLRDPANDFLALSRRTPIVRYTQQLNVRPPAAVTMPLRVLVMISAPQDFPVLDVEGEWQRLQEATAPLRERGLLELERLDSATLIALQRKMRAETFHIFHYIGHSDYDAASQQGVLVFENEKDESKGQIISGTALSRELAEESTIRLVVLNSCHSARRPDADALAGIASSIVVRGIPAVVAMQFAISDGAAKAFAEEFYRAMSEFLPLDAAMSEARRAISNRVGNNEWATPVLYMRMADGVLFLGTDRPKAEESETTTGDRKLTDRAGSASRGVLWGAIATVIVLGLALIGLTRLVNPPPPTPTATASALPDLQIGTMRISPHNPAPGQLFILSIPITNAGTAPSGAFRWAWDASTNPPVLSNSLSGQIDNIPPGASKNISFPFSYGWWGTYSSQLRVDVETQIDESDKSNNFTFLQVDMALQPFEVDFSRTASNEPVAPPLTLGADIFAPWNLGFAVVAGDNSTCAATPLTLVDQSGDILLTAGGDDPACKRLPLSVTILRAPVSAALVEISATAAGTATYRYYTDESGQQAIFQSPPVELEVGQVTQLSPNDGTARAIRRIDIAINGGVVQLTRLLLWPPNP